MGYSHNDKTTGVNGAYVGAPGSEVQIANADGYLYQAGTKLTNTGAVLNGAALAKIGAWFTNTVLDGSTGKKACVTNGVSSITGGTGIADMTLAAPSPGELAIIRINTLSSGSVVVTCATGVSVDGTNEIMTFDAAGESLVLAYKSATEWQIVLNIGGAVMSTAG